METKYGSEEIWRSSLALQRKQLAAFERNTLVRDKTRQRHEFQWRIARIFSAGLPEWQERDNAEFALPLPKA